MTNQWRMANHWRIND